MTKTTNDPLGRLSHPNRDKLREREQPSWMNPMLATLTDKRFSDDNWIFERNPCESWSRRWHEERRDDSLGGLQFAIYLRCKLRPEFFPAPQD